MVSASLCSEDASTLEREQRPQKASNWDCETLNGDCVAGERGESGVPGSKSRKLLASYLSAPARSVNGRWSEGVLEPFLLLLIVISGIASSGGVLTGSDSSEEVSDDPFDLDRISASSELSGWAFIGTLVVETWGRTEVG